MVEHPIDLGRLVLPHVHQHEDEYSYVLEGTIGARVVRPNLQYIIRPGGTGEVPDAFVIGLFTQITF